MKPQRITFSCDKPATNSEKQTKIGHFLRGRTTHLSKTSPDEKSPLLENRKGGAGGAVSPLKGPVKRSGNLGTLASPALKRLLPKPLPRKASKAKANCLKPNAFFENKEEWVRFVMAQPAMVIRALYPSAANSHRNTKNRCKKKGIPVHPDFETFHGFLCVLGPPPGPDYTLDRINNDDPEYAPGKVRWATKEKQANNRSTTIMLTYNGEMRPLTEWAKSTDQNSNTLRRRKREGWSDADVIFGKGSVANNCNRPWQVFESEKTVRYFDQEFFRSGSKDPMAFFRGKVNYVISEKKRKLTETEEWLEQAENDVAADEIEEAKACLSKLKKDIEKLVSRLATTERNSTARQAQNGRSAKTTRSSPAGTRRRLAK